MKTYKKNIYNKDRKKKKKKNLFSYVKYLKPPRREKERERERERDVLLSLRDAGGGVEPRSRGQDKQP